MANSQSLIIDGYNVLFQTPLMVADRGAYDYALSRKRLIGFVNLVIAPSLLKGTSLVFDSKQNRTEEPLVEEQPSGLQVVFASNYAEADQYIEDWIIHHPLPKSLVVVSSDGKIKSTARSYGAKTMESKDWYYQNLAKIPIAEQDWIQDAGLPNLPESQVAKSSVRDALDLLGEPKPEHKARAMRDLTDRQLADLHDFDWDE